VRTVSSEPCPLHPNPAAAIIGEGASTTPNVDAALRAAALRRVIAADGSVRYIRQ
jgi:hypothetical protein